MPSTNTSQDNTIKQLHEWFVTWIKNRSAFREEVLHEGKNGYDYLLQKGEKSTSIIIRNQLNEDAFSLLQSPAYLILANNKTNLSTVIRHWNTLSKNPELCIIFVNPIIAEKWVLYPFTHAKCTEPATLEKGLRSLMDAVPEWSPT